MDLRRKSDSICFTAASSQSEGEPFSEDGQKIFDHFEDQIHFLHMIQKLNLPSFAKTSHKEFWPRLTNEC